MIEMFSECVNGTKDLIEKQMEQSTRRRPEVSTAPTMPFSQASSEKETDTTLPRPFSSQEDCQGTSIINGKSVSLPSSSTWYSSTARMEVIGISP